MIVSYIVLTRKEIQVKYLAHNIVTNEGVDTVYFQ